ncbi:MAG: hypothetical protein RLZZ500_111 [Bacteroidota bacterium]|jgi:hypothetical protein
MKKLKLIPILAALFMLNVASMCSNDDNSSSSNAAQNQVIGVATSGTWRITYYNDSGTVKTPQFNGYNFTFGPSNVLTASNGTNTYSGTWSVTDSNSGDDTINDLDFNILFVSPANFADLSDDWDIQSQTSSKIELIDVSGGNGGTDYLTFEKN